MWRTVVPTAYGYSKKTSDLYTILIKYNYSRSDRPCSDLCMKFSFGTIKPKRIVTVVFIGTVCYTTDCSYCITVHTQET
jgi:hypothetical protein